MASYVPYVVSGNLVFISGQIPIGPGRPQIFGKLGADISLEDGKAAAKLCALNLLAQLKAACGGDLDRVRALRASWASSSTPRPISPSIPKSPMARPT